MLTLYIATSLDGKIARLNGDTQWLHEIPNPDGTDHGYAEFYQSIDIILMGNKTYQEILGFDIDFPYPDKDNYVFTRNKKLQQDENVQYVSDDPAGFVKSLKKESDKGIWLVGGAQVNSILLEAGLIDQIRVFIMPVVLGEGIPMFTPLPDQSLKLVSHEVYSTGAVEVTYKPAERPD